MGLVLQGVIATFLRVAAALIIESHGHSSRGVVGSIGGPPISCSLLFRSLPRSRLQRVPVIVLALVGITGSLNTPDYSDVARHAVVHPVQCDRRYVAIPQDLKYTTALLQVKAGRAGAR